jgi:hypothetical protein
VSPERKRTEKALFDRRHDVGKKRLFLMKPQKKSRKTSKTSKTSIHFMAMTAATHEVLNRNKKKIQIFIFWPKKKVSKAARASLEQGR